MTTLPPELQALLDEVDACDREAEALVAAMSDEEVNWQETPGQSWSVAQCLDHLSVTNTFYLRDFRPLVDQARQKGLGPFKGLRSSAGGRWFVRNLEPPVKQKFKAPKAVVPRSDLRRGGLVEALKAAHDVYREFLRACADVDVDRVKGPNPFFTIIPMRISTVLRIIPAHDRRHLWQAQQVRKALELRTKN